MDTKVIVDALPEIFTQLAAFLIAFWVLKAFAFKPILAAIDARRSKIENEFRSIEDAKKSIASLEADYKNRLEKIEDEARRKIQEASRLGTELARDIQQKARQDAEKLALRAKSEIEHDLAKAKIALREQIVELSLMITEKAVRSTVDPAGHKKLVEKFLEDAGRLN